MGDWLSMEHEDEGGGEPNRPSMNIEEGEERHTVNVRGIDENWMVFAHDSHAGFYASSYEELPRIVRK
jgi:hypothetical protein